MTDLFLSDDRATTTSSSSPHGSEQPEPPQDDIGNDAALRREYLAALGQPKKRIRCKRKAGESNEGPDDEMGIENERYRLLARHAVWCAFLVGASQPKVVGDAIRNVWGVSSLSIYIIEPRECLLT